MLTYYQRYFFHSGRTTLVDPRIAVSDLASTSIAYLCTDSFEPCLADDQVKENLKSGRYRMCSYASSQWLRLVLMMCARSCQTCRLPDSLTSLLEEFVKKRENGNFRLEHEQQVPEPPELEFVVVSPNVRTMLCRMAYFFQKQDDAGDWRLSRGNDPIIPLPHYILLNIRLFLTTTIYSSH